MPEFAGGGSVSTRQREEGAKLGLSPETLESDALDGDSLDPLPAEAPLSPAGEREKEKPETEAATPETQPENFEFAGQKFKDRAAAEKQFKSAVGGTVGLQRQNVALEKSAREWVSYGDALAARNAELEAELTTLRSGKPSPSARAQTQDPAQSQANPDSDDLVSGMDWETYNLMQSSEDPEIRNTAGLFLAQQTLEAAKKMLARERESMKAALAPIESQRELQAATTNLTNIYQAVMGRQYADGSLMYPELHEQESASQVLKIWKALPILEEKRFSPEALHLAVAHLRTARRTSASSPQPAPPRQTAASPEAIAAGEQVISSLEARTRSGDSIVGRPSGNAGLQRPETPGERNRREMRERPIYNHLGFEP